MGPVTTMRDLARLAGVSVTTVSYALRDSRRVKQTTRERIRRLADEHGYRADPALSARYGYGRRRSSQAGQIAVIADSIATPKLAETGFMRRVCAGIEELAGELCYDLLPIDRAESSNTAPHRQIRGAIFLTLRDPALGACVDRGHLATVVIGPPPLELPMDSVGTDDHHALWTCWCRLFDRGHRRIGLLLHPHTDVQSRHRWSSAYAGVQQIHACEPLPICPYQHEPEAIAAWIAAHRLDAIIARKPLRQAVAPAAARLGLAIPGDLGFASLAVHGDDGEEAGIRHDHRLLGRAALRRVDSRIRTGDLGPPSHPSSELVAGTWVEGASLRSPTGSA